MKTALVTGGSGYFGEVVARRLKERGYKVRVFDLVDNADRASDIELIRGDIRDASAIARACEGIDVVHHNVAQVPLAKDKELFWTVNVDGTRNLLDAVKKAGVKKTVLVSSSAIFGVPPRNPVDDSVQPAPREEYGRAKLAGEDLARERVRRDGLDVSIVRPRTILGHGRLGIFQILFEWVRTGSNVFVLGKGDNRYQFVHADDLCEACVLAGERAGSSTYNVGTDRFGTMRELLEGLVQHAGTKSRVRSLPMRPAVLGMELTSRLGVSPLGGYHSLMYGREMFFDLSRTRSELGWAPKFSNHEMICESYDYYVKNRDEILARSNASHHRSPLRQGVLKLLEYVP
ncbi:MAG: NAD-dependent epimerase/dehydratase family protein [Archangium sp.]